MNLLSDFRFLCYIFKQHETRKDFFVEVLKVYIVSKKSTELDFVHPRMIGPFTTQWLFFNTYFLSLVVIFHSYRSHGSFSNADTQ